MDFTSDALVAAEKGFDRLMEAMNRMDEIQTQEKSSADIPALVAQFYTAMNDDFNAPILVANLFEAVKLINGALHGSASISNEDLNLLKTEMHAFVEDVLGLTSTDKAADNKLSPVMDLVLDLRQEARDRKDWGTSDKIRDALSAAGIVVKDTKDGTTWS
ncbi:MAG: hypothetical protein A3D92_04995 [Bacteroidetes bacterium RIFCSPHIGHO2_02_FULL_44_7]|nr:MAG: hypothetical protein A3D92_04995 [Bacteroidetes bacterium RIFCSPHIGHO2_02_FULL_44_7]